MADIQIQMLGDFVISSGNRQIEDRENRTKKIWLVLAYLIRNRDRVVSQNELVYLLWGEEPESANPAGALKTVLHRVRTALSQLEVPGEQRLILSEGGGYIWNPAVSVQLDVELFEEEYRLAYNAEDEDERLAHCMEAFKLYRGDFLSRIAGIRWVENLSLHYREIYLQTAQEALPLLQARGRYREAAELARAVLRSHPVNELLYRHLMQSLLELGDQKGVAAAYEEMSSLLLSGFGVMPSEQTRAIYRRAIRGDEGRIIPPGAILERLKEDGPVAGALLCDFDFFKVLYQAQARCVVRSGDPVHVVMLTVNGPAERELSGRSLACAMENLADILKGNLRKGDVISRCSASQYVLMLLRADYDDSCLVCDRLIKAFARRYPHSPAKLSALVQPLEPIE